MFEIYSKKQIYKNVYMITEQESESNPFVNMYLVVGNEESMLFDSGFGVVDILPDVIKELTDTPVFCVVGHGHPDHVGAAELFRKVYMNERDDSLLPIALSYERRMDDIFSNGDVAPEIFEYAKEHIVDPGGNHFIYTNTKAGDTFNVDDDTFEVFEIPGHTQGSIALLNQKENYAFISDAVGKRTALVTLPLKKRVGLEMYRDGLIKFMEQINDDTLLWSGHSKEPMPHEMFEDMLKAVTDVLDGKTENDVVSVSKFAKRKAASSKRMMEHTEGSIMLVYDANLL